MPDLSAAPGTASTGGKRYAFDAGLHVGLTGGYATGKSGVGEWLHGLGCELIQMDRIGHQVLDPGGEAYGPAIAEFGTGILNPDQSIDRKRLGAMVFADPEKLARLNALVHPPARARARAQAGAFLSQHPRGIAVTEAAILIETGSYREYDRLIVVTCRPEQQIERAMARDGLARERVLDRIRRQMPLEEKRKFADFVVDTSGSREETHRQTGQVFEALRAEVLGRPA